MGPPIDPDHARDRLGKLIDNPISFGDKDSVIPVAQIFNAANGQTQSLIRKYNDAIPGVVHKPSGQQHIAVVDFRDKLQASDYAEGLHPSHSGYRKMAHIWFEAIQDAANKGLSNSSGPKTGVPGHWLWDGPHNVTPGAPGAKASSVLFGDINRDRRPDYLVKNSNGGLDAYFNIGKPKTIDGIQWKPVGHIA
ncbi:MAG: hypothetical protein Q9226_001878 [Calogaya cf. arnoldii]